MSWDNFFDFISETVQQSLIEEASQKCSKYDLIKRTN